MLDVTGPAQVFSSANSEMDGSETGYDIVIASATGGMIETDTGLKIDTVSIADLPNLSGQSIDTIVVAGGGGVFKASEQGDVVVWLRQHMQTTRRTVSTCMGVFLAAETGLLGNRDVTTHWRWCDELQKQYPEIVDFYLPPEGCSYRMAVVTIKKQYPGHAKRIMMGVWSYLRQFMYTKFVIVTDDDVNARDWNDVIWALTTRVDPTRDTTLIDHTPIDYLDFASPVSGLGSKMGIDATSKWEGETNREWGIAIEKDPKITKKIIKKS